MVGCGRSGRVLGRKAGAGRQEPSCSYPMDEAPLLMRSAFYAVASCEAVASCAPCRKIDPRAMAEARELLLSDTCRQLTRALRIVEGPTGPGAAGGAGGERAETGGAVQGL